MKDRLKGKGKGKMKREDKGRVNQAKGKRIGHTPDDPMVREAIQVVKNLDYHVSPQSLLLLGHPLVSDALTLGDLVSK